MRMSFHETCVGDADEFRPAESLDILRAAVSHTCTETSYELVHHFRESTLVRHLGYDSFRNEFLDIVLHILEIPVLRSLLHGFERAHSPVRLEFTAVQDNSLTRRLLDSCEERSGHDGAGTCSQSLDHISGISDTAVRYDRDTCSFQCIGSHHHC